MDGTSFSSPDSFGGFGGGNYNAGADSGSPYATENFSTMGSFGTGGTGTATHEATRSPTPASDGTSTSQMIGYGLGGAALLGAGMKAFGGGGGTKVNLDPYGTGAQAASEAQMLWKRYNTGEIMPGDQAKIAQWQQAQIQQTKDYYAKAGLSDSSMAQEAIGQIGQQADQMRQQAHQNLLAPAMQATGMANDYAKGLVAYQIQQDQQAQQAQKEFMATLATIGMALL